MAARRGNKGALWAVERSLIVGEMRASAGNSVRREVTFPTNSSLKGSVSTAQPPRPRPCRRPEAVACGGASRAIAEDEEGGVLSLRQIKVTHPDTRCGLQLTLNDLRLQL